MMEDIDLLFQQAARCFQQGQWAEAEILAQRILGMSEAHAEANHLLGLVAIEQGDFALAERRITRAIEANPSQSTYYYNLGLALRSAGNPAGALVAYGRALELNPGFIQAHVNRGMVLRDMGRLEEAVSAYECAIRFNPNQPGPYYNQGNVLSDLGRSEEALACYERAIRLKPGFVDAYINRGNVLRDLERSEEALACYERAIRLNPNNAKTYLNQGNALSDLGRSEEALSCYEQAIRLKPGFVDAHINRGNALSEQGLSVEALAAYERALELDPGFVDAHINRGNALSELGRPEEALAAYEQAIRLNPENADARYNLALMLELLGQLDKAYLECSKVLDLNPDYDLAIALQAGIRRRQGRYDEAVALFEPLIRGGVNHPRIAEAFVSLCSHMGRCEEALSLSRDICESTGHTRRDLMFLHFSTAHALDRLGRFDEAFVQFKNANRLRNAKYDINGVRRFVDAIMEVHNAELCKGIQRHYISKPKLIFIIGMPRSGTTLAEQILSSHPAVYGAGELKSMSDIRDNITSLTGTGVNYPHCMSEMDEAKIDILRQEYLSRLPDDSHGVPFVTDKHLGNIMSVGLIHTLFPDSAIIHCTRDPRDTCISCYMNNFTSLPYSYDLTSLGKTWREYRRLMQHWETMSVPMMTLSYEALVNDQERVSRQLVEYCGLQWDEACLHFEDNDRNVLTVSRDQVNQPIYRSSVGRWRNYEGHLDPLIDALNGLS